MSSLTVSVVVQSVPGRPQWANTKRCIEASDIGTAYRVVHQRPGVPPRSTFLEVLDAMNATGTDLVVRLEDDLGDVNPYILHNATTWGALHDSRFGCGWLFAPGGINPVFYGSQRWHDHELHCSLAVILWRRDLPTIRRHVVDWFSKSPGKLSQDLALTHALTKCMGRRIAIHGPSLVTHASGPSTLNNTHGVHDTDNGSYEPTYRR